MDEKEDMVLDDIRKCTKKIAKSSDESTAYFRALGKFKGLDMDKFRKEVQQEQEAEEKSTDEG